MMNTESKHYFEFGSFRIDTQEKALLRDGVPVPLTPKVYEILIALVENHGRTLSNDELLDRVWTDAFVEVGNLNRNISTLRSVLGDNSQEPKFIKTLPKRGYRFDADVREIIEDDNALVIERRKNFRIALREETTLTSVSSITFTGKKMAATAFAAAFLIIGMVWAFNKGPANSETRVAAATADTDDHTPLELYQNGRSLWQDRSGESLHKATLLLEQAVAADPNFALAYAALADAYAFDSQNRTKAVSTASRAIQLDPNLGEPHATIGFVRMFWDWKFSEAESHFRQAVTLSPNYATGHQWYAISLQATGQGNAAVAEMKRALEIEPDSLAINADVCQILYFNRRLDEAEAQCMKTLAMNPKFLNANLYLYDVLTAKGKYDDALSQFYRNELQLSHYSAFPGKLTELKTSYETAGIRSFWRKRIEMLKQLPSTDYAIAIYYARLNEKDETFRWLERAYEKRDLNFFFFPAEPAFFVCCYSDPRWAELEERLFSRQNADRP